ncbi:MAG TPA: HAMP domain-containing sensor histidine kinase, partial [Leptospiraceae bacterium]|nr:HAMP domain-containing sensor histidine kinase [Leptospiraceae bacterium]
ENLNHTKDKFFNIIAHDLKNPFAGILGISEMLESKLKESESQYTKEDLLKMANLIQSSARSASNLLDNLLHWARSQTGELQCDLIITSINSIIEATIPLISGIAFNKQIEIEKNLDAEKFVLADPSLTNTILRNLFTNSIKFTNPGGKIIVRTKFNNDYAEISIEDTGIGIKEEHLSKLFRIDSKITKLGTNGEKGTGLGLILCKEFTEKQNGKIWVESEFNKGSKFTFILPIAL